MTARCARLRFPPTTLSEQTEGKSGTLVPISSDSPWRTNFPSSSLHRNTFIHLVAISPMRQLSINTSMSLLLQLLLVSMLTYVIYRRHYLYAVAALLAILLTYAA